MPLRADTPAPLGTHRLTRAVVSAVVPNVLEADFVDSAGVLVTLRLNFVELRRFIRETDPLTALRLSDPTTTEHHA